MAFLRFVLYTISVALFGLAFVTAVLLGYVLYVIVANSLL